MRILPPQIDDRTLEQIVQRAKTLASFYTPEWKPTFEKEPGTALLNIFAYLLDNVLSRFNRAADKNFLAFLDMLDIALLPARSARVPVTFQLAEGALQNMLIPSGTQVSAAAKDNVHEELTFETEKNVLATPARLQRVLSIAPDEDKIFEHPTSFDESKPFKPFTGTNVQEHILYLAHSELFNFKSMVNIELNINLEESSRNVGIASDEVLWEHWDGKSWLELNVSEDKTRRDEGKTLQKSGTLTLAKQCEGENAELEVIPDKKNRWIRGRIIAALPHASAALLPKFDTLKARAFPPNEIFPDLIFSSDVPLNLSTVLPETAMLAVEAGPQPLKFSPDPQSEGGKVGPQKGDKSAHLSDVSMLRNDDWLSFSPVAGEKEHELHQIIIGKKDGEPNLGGQINLKSGDSFAYDYTQSSGKEKIVLLTALRKAAIDHAQTRTVRVSTIEGFQEGKRVVLVNYSGARDEAKISKILFKGKDEKDNPLPFEDKLGNKYFEMELTTESSFENDYLQGDKILLQEFDGIFPFGIDPRLFSAFYIANQEAFSKKGARVTLYFEFQPKNPLTELAGSAFQNLVDKVNALGDDILKKNEGIKLAPIRESVISRLNKGEASNVITTLRIFIKTAKESQGLNETQRSDLIAAADLVISKIDDYDKIEPKLSWEYWNGSGWQLLRTLKNTVNHFKGKLDRKEALIVFVCPSDMAPTEVLGQKNYWIRARLVDGDYGKIEFEYDDNVEPPVLKPVNNVNPPQITWLNLKYDPDFQNLEHCLAFNSLTYEDFSAKSKTRGESFTPFQALDYRHDSLYLGFDKALTSGPLRLFFSVTEQQVQEATRPKIEWSYWDGRTEFWKKLTGVDNTEALTRTDELEILGSKDFARKKMFGQELFWLRGSLIEGQYEAALELKGIYPNTTWAFQAGRVEGETLGASTGAAQQEFPLLRFPIISQQIFVQEPNAPSALEQAVIIKAEDEDAIQEVRDTSDKITGYKIRWHEVPDFYSSGPADRHYRVDHARGRVRFGDGVRGMIPPAGENNLSANYTFGGGNSGNSVEAGEITSLKAAIPTVKGVTNPLPAGGGSDTETTDGVLVRGPQTFKHRERAVAAEDYEWLAKAASQNVARARCLPNVNNLRLPELGWITIIIVPDSKESKPLPSPQLLARVSRYLGQHAANSVIAPRHLHVTRPEYVEIKVTAEVAPAALDEAASAEKKILEALDNFFHPLTGGPEKRGWDFGSTIMVSQVYTLLESIREVAYVKGLALSAEGRFSREKIAIPEHALVCSGAHDIRVILEEDNVSAYSQS